MTQLVARRRAIGGGASSPYKAAILAEPSLVSYWRLDEAGVGIAKDQTQRNPGTYGASGITYGTPGPLARCGDLDTGITFTNGQITIPHNSSLNTSTWTVEAWVIGFSATFVYFSNLYVAGGQNSLGYRMYFNLGGQLNVDLPSGTTLTGRTGNIYDAIVPNIWAHAVVTYDGSNIVFYINGEFIPLTSPSTYTSFAINTIAPATIGGNSNAGSVDEVAVYNTALSGADVRNHYSVGTNNSVVVDSDSGLQGTPISSWTHTASTVGCSNGFLVICGFNATGACTVNGVTATRIGFASPTLYVWGMKLGIVAPSATYSIVITTGGFASGGSVLYDGVNQTTPTAGMVVDLPNASPFTTTAVSSVAGAFVISVVQSPVASGATIPTVVLGTGTGALTTRFADTRVLISPNSAGLALADSRETVNENVTFTWSITPGNGETVSFNLLPV